MDIGMVTIAYKGYGKFLKQWCYFMSQLDTPASEYTVVLGKSHGCDNLDECLAILPELKVIKDDVSDPCMGKYRNLAIRNTKTEWIQFLSVDDMILPHAIDAYAEHTYADYISITWMSTELDNPMTTTLHKAITPAEMASHGARGFIIGHSPFRRWLWEKNPYELHDYINYPFLAGAINSGAKFAKTKRPCTVYLRRSSSHARTVLPRPSEKKQAQYQKRKLEATIISHYKEEYASYLRDKARKQ